LGFRAESIPAENQECGRHLLLHRSGTGDTALLLVGHLDTVYSEEDLKRDEFGWREEGDRVFGPGTADMKGGDVMIWLILKALRQADPAFFDSIHWHVHFNAAEEILPPDFANASCQHLHPNTRAALVFEYGATDGRIWEILTGRKGRVRIRIRVEGKGAHAAYPEKGASAIRQLAQIVLKVESLNDPQRGLTVNVGRFHSGHLSNKVPHLAEAELEVRAPDKATMDEAMAAIWALDGLGTVSTEAGEFTCRVHIQRIDRIEAWAPDNPDSLRLGNLWQEVGKRLGLEVKPCVRGGLSDGNFLAATGLPTLDGLGPAGGNLHASGNDPERGLEPEFMRLDTFAEKCLLNALAIRRLADA
jgi:glutamate carboxypeptidase